MWDLYLATTSTEHTLPLWEAPTRTTLASPSTFSLCTELLSPFHPPPPPYAAKSNTNSALTHPNALSVHFRKKPNAKRHSSELRVTSMKLLVGFYLTTGYNCSLGRIDLHITIAFEKSNSFLFAAQI
ncbi:hypothetical protein Ancab_000478 [Ancistrocladus abbreviatus]